MGDNLTHETPNNRAASNLATLSLPHWLDTLSGTLVRDIVIILALHYPDLLAVILFGSVARHAERSLADPRPSDVDLLAIFDTDDDPTLLPRGLHITHVIRLARNRHLDVPREVPVMFATRDLREWDATFVANVARWHSALVARHFACGASSHSTVPFTFTRADGSPTRQRY